MTDRPADPIPDPPGLEPNTLAGAEFARARKGFEPTEVRALLGRASDALRAWKERDDRLSARLAELERRLDESQELDEDRITAVLGEETARIVAAARGAATDIRSKAQEQADTLIRETEASATSKAATLTGEAQALRDEAAKLRDDADTDAAAMRQEAAAAAEATRTDAQDHADRVRSEASAEHDSLLAAAKGVLDERTTEAESVAAGIREAAQIELDAAHADGARLRQESRDAAAAEVDRAREEGRSMVDEARQLRRQMLQDLAERRRTARQQIEAARAGRDRIVEALGAAGDRVAAVIGELSEVDGAAQRAADVAAASVDDDIDAVVAQLETGLTFGGLPLLSESSPASSAVAADSTGSTATGSTALAGEIDNDLADEIDSDADDVARVAVADLREVVEVHEVVEVIEVTESVEVVDVVELSVREPDVAGAGADERSDERTRTEASSGDEGAADEDVAGDVDVDAGGGAETAAGDAADEGGSVELAGDEEPSPGATVHDLFERIRAERQSEIDAHPAFDDADDFDLEDEEEDEDEDEGEDAVGGVDLTGGDSDVDGELADVVVLEQPGAPAPSHVDVGSENAVTEGAPTTDVGAEAAAVTVAVIDHVQATSSALDRRDALLVEVEKSMSRSLKRLVSDEQNEVLDRLRRIRRGRPDTATLLPEGDDEITFTLGLHDDYAAAAVAGARFWAGESNADEAAATEAVDADVVEGGLEIRVSELLGLRRAHIHRALEHAVDGGVELAELADPVRAAYREWRTRSVPDLAADLAASGFALGEQAAAGEGGNWCWMVDNGGLPCSDADDNALAGPVACGSTFPTGDVIPPAHSGCRCILVPAPR